MTEPKEIRSIRELARQAGRGESTVRKWLKRRDWPFPRKGGPWQLSLVQQWMALHLHPDPAQRYHDAKRGIGPMPVSELEKVRTENFFEAKEIRRLKREQLQGRLHDVEGCRRRRVAQVLQVRNVLTRRLPRALSAELVGRSRGDMEALLRRRLAQVCEEFARGDGPEPPPAAEVPA